MRTKLGAWWTSLALAAIITAIGFALGLHILIVPGFVLFHLLGLPVVLVPEAVDQPALPVNVPVSPMMLLVACCFLFWTVAVRLGLRVWDRKKGR